MIYEDDDGFFDKVELETKSLLFVINNFKEILSSYLKKMLKKLHK